MEGGHTRSQVRVFLFLGDGKSISMEFSLSSTRLQLVINDHGSDGKGTGAKQNWRILGPSLRLAGIHSTKVEKFIRCFCTTSVSACHDADKQLMSTDSLITCQGAFTVFLRRTCICGHSACHSGTRPGRMASWHYFPWDWKKWESLSLSSILCSPMLLFLAWDASVFWTWISLEQWVRRVLWFWVKTQGCGEGKGRR